MSFADDAQTINVAEGGPRTIRFTRYVRVVLPLDGYVFWVKTNLLGPSSILNTSPVGSATLDGGPHPTPPATFEAAGALHYETTVAQDESEVAAVNRVIFTAKSPIVDLNALQPNEMYLGEVAEAVPGGGLDLPRTPILRFAFSARSWFFEQAGIHHYSGTAVYPDMATQIVDTLSALDARTLIASDSMPAWLALNNYTPFYGFKTPVTLYPAMLSPRNLTPPFGTVSVQDTSALASAPSLAQDSSHEQLARDRVRITLWGCSNAMAMNFLDAVDQYTLDTDNFGLANMAIAREDKRGQVELGTLAQKKIVDFEVNYLQGTARNIARQLILEAVPSYVLEDV